MTAPLRVPMASTAVSVLLLLLLGLSDFASAQIVGTTRSATRIVEDSQTASGWSAKESILGQNLFNDAGENVGRIEDLIVDRERNVAYLVVGVGGIGGMGRHAIAIPASQVRASGDRLVLPGATRIALAALPRFVYVPVTRTHSSIVARAESDVDRAKRKVLALTGSALNASDVQRGIIEDRIAEIERGQGEVEARISEMTAADGAGWKAKELEVAEASARLRIVIRESR